MNGEGFFFLLVQQGILLDSLPPGKIALPSDSQTTLRSSLSPSPIPSTSVRPLEEISEHGRPETDLKLIETPNVFPDETSYSVVRWLMRSPV